jgi:uncharacterized protein with FMN-binding domain
MRKYLQITIVLGLFFSFVVFKNLPIPRGDDEENIQVGTKNQIDQLSPAPTIIPQATASIDSTFVPNITPTSSGKFKNGTYIGSVEDAFYGNIQVQVVVSGGKITDVIFLDHPQDNRTSISINSQAMPMLKAEAISAQSANVDTISGASDSSMAFQKSLASALSQAK